MGLGKLLVAGGVAMGLMVGGAAAVEVARDSRPRVVKIVDGDTLDVRWKGETTRVRLLNVDTPEIGRDGEASECFADEAKRYLEQRLPAGTEVELQYDEERLDQYGRTLAGVFLGEELLNASIAKEGLGIAVQYAPNVKYYEQVRAAERQARGQQLRVFGAGMDCFGLSQPVQEAWQQMLAAEQTAYEAVGGAEAAAVAGLAQLAQAEALLKSIDAADWGMSELERALYAFKFTSLKAEHRSFQYGLRRELQSVVDKAEAQRKAEAEAQRKAEEEAKRKAEAEARRKAEEEAKRQAEAQARRKAAAEQERKRAKQTPAPAPKPKSQSGAKSTQSSKQSTKQQTKKKAPSKPAAKPKSSSKYTGCRDYGNKLPPNAVDKKGRPFTKIDCDTGAPIG